LFDIDNISKLYQIFLNKSVSVQDVDELESIIMEFQQDFENTNQKMIPLYRDLNVTWTQFKEHGTDKVHIIDQFYSVLLSYLTATFTDFNNAEVKNYLNKLSNNEKDFLNINLNRISTYDIDRIFSRKLCDFFAASHFPIDGYIGRESFGQTTSNFVLSSEIMLCNAKTILKSNGFVQCIHKNKNLHQEFGKCTPNQWLDTMENIMMEPIENENKD
jgi:hypothetical protein